MTSSEDTGVLARWMAFENGAFRLLLRIERQVRALPSNVRLRPGTFDRRVFRLFCGTLASLVAIMALPARLMRVRALLLLIGFLIVCVVVLVVLDVHARRRR